MQDISFKQVEEQDVGVKQEQVQVQVQDRYSGCARTECKCGIWQLSE